MISLTNTLTNRQQAFVSYSIYVLVVVYVVVIIITIVIVSIRMWKSDLIKLKYSKSIHIRNQYLTKKKAKKKRCFIAFFVLLIRLFVSFI